MRLIQRPATASRGPYASVPWSRSASNRAGPYAVATALALGTVRRLRPAPRAMGLGVPCSASRQCDRVARLTSFLGVAPRSPWWRCPRGAAGARDGLFASPAVGVFTGPLATGLLGSPLAIGLAPEGSRRRSAGLVTLHHGGYSLAIAGPGVIAAALYCSSPRAQGEALGRFPVVPPLSAGPAESSVAPCWISHRDCWACCGFGVRYAGALGPMPPRSCGYATGGLGMAVVYGGAPRAAGEPRSRASRASRRCCRVVALSSRHRNQRFL